MQGLDPIVQLQLEAVDLAVGPHSTASKKQSRENNSSMTLILQDISCKIMKQDRLAIVGPSGSGKTSLLRLLNRLVEPTHGRIYWEQQDVQQIPVLQLRQKIVLVSQETRLLGMTVQEAIRYPLQLRHVAPSEQTDRLSYWLEQLQLPTDWLDKTELQLSVGQRQWVAIARALVTNPTVLLLDEPTSALDRGKSHRLMEVLLNLAQTHGTTILMINHQLDLAEEFANRVFYLHQGRLLQDVESASIHWPELHDRLIQAEQAESEEWG